MVQFWTRISSKLEPAPPVDSKPMPPVDFEVASVPNWPLTLWTFNPTRWMWWEAPVAITRTPRRVPAVDAVKKSRGSPSQWREAKDRQQGINKLCKIRHVTPISHAIQHLCCSLFVTHLLCFAVSCSTTGYWTSIPLIAALLVTVTN